MAELPRALRITAEFFAQDLPEEERNRPAPRSPKPSRRCGGRSGSVVPGGGDVVPSRAAMPLRRAGVHGRRPRSPADRWPTAAGPRVRRRVCLAAGASNRRSRPGARRISLDARWRGKVIVGTHEAGAVAMSPTDAVPTPAASRCGLPFANLEPRQWMKLRLVSESSIASRSPRNC